MEQKFDNYNTFFLYILNSLFRCYSNFLFQMMTPVFFLKNIVFQPSVLNFSFFFSSRLVFFSYSI
ncbi:hypothetical protein BY996DRAFT_8251671 [Phakopsora pachyrhizi]|nr:hypothetical protein BY996DRAFT_8251671 [Phakopsora pachyrhizi]